jgi:diguanylate cyclase (GGDEF)-like protein
MSNEEDSGQHNDELTTNPNKTVVTVIGPTTRKPDLRDSCLIVIYGDDLGRRIPLSERPVTVGRSSRCDVQFDQESVSRNHCRVSVRGDHFTIRDLGSTNGTYVNDELCDEIQLRDGDQIKVGRTILKFISSGNIEGQYHEEIYRLMTVDGLTELHNKRYFEEMLERESSRARRYGRTFSLILFDIDWFKQINDTNGHLAGDAVLRQLGALVKQHVRRDDILSRTGGEEFGIIVPEIQKEGGVELAEKLRKIVEEAVFDFEDTTMNITISLGVAQWERGMDEPEDLVRLADARLYEAKNGGRNQVCA